jgi:hypothetical protein
VTASDVLATTQMTICLVHGKLLRTKEVCHRSDKPTTL